MRGRDVAKMAEALSRPRIDPRKFVELGVVIAVAVDGDGAHYDVVNADGSHETVALAPAYGGPGYGLYTPTELDEVAVIVVPDGSPNAGGRIVGKIWDPGAPPPAEAISNPEDVALVVKPGQSIRIIVSGGGTAIVEARDGGHVELGKPGTTLAPRNPALSTADGAAFMQALQSAIDAQSGNPPGAAALAALQTALTAINWPSGAAGVLVK